MGSTFIRRIFEEEIAEVEAAMQRRFDAERRQDEVARREAELLESLQSMVEDTVAIRFPAITFGRVRVIRRLSDPHTLQTLNTPILCAADQAEAERILDELGERRAG